MTSCIINDHYIKENPPWKADLGAMDTEVHSHRPVALIYIKLIYNTDSHLHSTIDYRIGLTNIPASAPCNLSYTSSYPRHISPIIQSLGFLPAMSVKLAFHSHSFEVILSHRLIKDNRDGITKIKRADITDHRNTDSIAFISQ